VSATQPGLMIGPMMPTSVPPGGDPVSIALTTLTV
jgi:hypothetical protein